MRSEIEGMFRRARLSAVPGSDITVSVTVSEQYPVMFRDAYAPQDVRDLVGGVLDRLGGLSVMLVSDEHVGASIGQRVLEDLRTVVPHVDMITFPPGEASKDVSRLIDLWSQFRERGVERRTLLIGIGGGVVCDIVGLAAATYLRGLPYILIPTSLMAQADAAVGGKVGADFAGTKNWVGAFYHPAAVVGYTEHLRTLDDGEFANGFAEVIKLAMVAGQPLWSQVASCDLLSLRYDRTVLADLVRACAVTKLDMLSSDPLELSSLDRKLNFGHCVGHAVEAASEFQFRHGEAVAIGMATAIRIGCARGECSSELLSELETLLKAFGLPTEVPPDLIEPSWQRLEDVRKVRNGSLRLVVPTAPGRMVFLEDLTLKGFREAAASG